MWGRACNDVQEAMKLTPEQQDCLLKARNTYLAEVGRLLEERRKLQTTLRVSINPHPCPRSSSTLDRNLGPDQCFCG